MIKCVKCTSELVGGVPFCPFCGQAVAGAPAPRPVAAVAPPAPTVMPAPVPVPTPKAEPKAEPVVPTVPPRVEPLRASTAKPRPPAPVKKWPRWLAGIVVLGLVVAYMNGKPGGKNESACNDAIDSGLKLVAGGSLDGARQKLATAKLACSGQSSAKAEDLQAAISKAGAASGPCQRSARAIKRELDGARLRGAGQLLDKLDADCAGAATVDPLRKQLARQQAAAASAHVAVRQALNGKDGVAAQNGIAKLEAIDREYPELKQLKADLQALTAANAMPAAVPASPTDAAPVRSVERRPVDAAPVDNGAAMRTEMGQSFLRDAERSLAEGKFDAAKTYLDSARRADPGNVRIDSLSRRIREREHQVLQTETAIK